MESENLTNAKHSREKWDNDIEFLFSCIALSVGLGNIWRFPFIALQNGGGAFLIPYIIVLLLIGRPVYYMEVIIGQFSSQGCINAFNMAPIMKGVAYGQVIATFLATTYYASIMAITLKYLISSLSMRLPWSYCRPEWGDECIGSTEVSKNSTGKYISSAELYFTKSVLNEADNIHDGVGYPNWELVFYLLVVWVIIGIILIKGIKSSGKFAYFLAIFPYIVLLLLLCRAVTLPGAIDGIIYFLKPQWNSLFDPSVWYAAITQMFFSLAICLGTLIMYASYNNFRKNVYRDVVIVTTIDSFTSILAGCIIFGVLGNLANEMHTTDISNVVKSGAGLAFISYPEAIAKFKLFPQLFAILFFLMLLVLGIGSNIGMVSCVTTVIRDRFNNLPQGLVAAAVATASFICGIVYTTPGGQFILNLVDYFGCSFIALALAIGELIAIGWVYGVKNLCRDIAFMCKVKTGIYWRLCWAVITPTLMLIVFIYTLVNSKQLSYKGVVYPNWAYNAAWIVWAIGIGQCPLWALYTIYKQEVKTLPKKIKSAMKPTKCWGPLDPNYFEDYQLFKENNKTAKEKTIFQKICQNIFE